MARKIERELTPNFIKIYFDEEGDAIDAVLSGPKNTTNFGQNVFRSRNMVSQV